MRIIELIKNIDCWTKIFLWFKTKMQEIVKPIKLTKMPVVSEIINELLNALIKLGPKIIFEKLLFTVSI